MRGIDDKAQRSRTFHKERRYFMVDIMIVESTTRIMRH
jgi:hypothetical protein